MPITLQEARPGLTHKRPSYRPTGTHPSPRSVLEWRSAIRTNSLSSTSRPTLCTHWSLMEHTAPPHWVVTLGRRWLVHRPHCSTTVTRKGLMPWLLEVTWEKQGSVFLVTKKMTATPVIPDSGLVQEGILMTPTRVETKQRTHQIMETNTSKPWVISWCSDKNCLHALCMHFIQRTIFCLKIAVVNRLTQLL